MPNPNPIQVNSPGVQINYSIGAANAAANITLTIAIDITAADWNYVPLCQIFLNGVDLYPASSPEPADLLLGTGASLTGKTLYTSSNVAKIYPAGGAAGAYPPVSYQIIIKANGVALDTFPANDAAQVSSNFNATLLFV